MAQEDEGFREEGTDSSLGLLDRVSENAISNAREEKVGRERDPKKQSARHGENARGVGGEGGESRKRKRKARRRPLERFRRFRVASVRSNGIPISL